MKELTIRQIGDGSFMAQMENITVFFDEATLGENNNIILLHEGNCIGIISGRRPLEVRQQFMALYHQAKEASTPIGNNTPQTNQINKLGE